MTDKNENETVYYASQNDAVNTNDEKEEKMFTQSQLEEIIRERLSRERRVNESLHSVKTLLKSAAEKGLIKGSSYSEMAKELVARLGGDNDTHKAKALANEGEQTESLNAICCDMENDEQITEKNQPEISGELCCAVADVQEAQNDIGDNKTEEPEVEQAPDNGDKTEDMGFAQLLCDIKSRYSKQELQRLVTDDLFERFAKGRSGSMREIIDDFFSFISLANHTESQMENDMNSANGYSSFASTAFSSQSGSPEVSANLTKQQMEIAKSAGMSYREYQSLLESVPQRTKRTF